VGDERYGDDRSQFQTPVPGHAGQASLVVVGGMVAVDTVATPMGGRAPVDRKKLKGATKGSLVGLEGRKGQRTREEPPSE
jgi:hypothetical protein